MRDPNNVWVIEDHLCLCGGRILRYLGPRQSTGGSLYKCSDCGKEKEGMSPGALCWCGQKHKNNNITAYRCLPFSILKDRPYLKDEFLQCGCDPTRGEVGIVLEKRLNELFKEHQK
jgi:hypothetical protein